MNPLFVSSPNTGMILRGTLGSGLFTFLILGSAMLMAPRAEALNAGDLMFTSFNADEDGWAMVALAPIPANTTVYFTDNEWDGTVFNTGESYNQWVSGASVIPAGTVIRFLAVDQATLSSSVGTLTRATVSGSSNWGISTGEDAVYAYQATTVSSTPTVFLSAICNKSFGVATAGVLTNTGLSVGNGALQTGFSGGSDFAEYTGTRTGQANFAAYLPIISTVANWTVDTTDGVYGTTVPNTASFSIAPATPAVNLSVSASTGSEAGATAVTVTATAGTSVSGDQTVSLAVSGTGITAGDYTLSNTTITILNGSTTGSVTFTIVNDLLLEGPETATLAISSPSSGMVLGATISQNVVITDDEASVDLSRYVRVGRYDLPEPTRTTPPANSLLAQEASGVAYNWDTNTLFIVGDGGTSVTEVTKTGQLVSSMTLPPGGSAQGTEFFDTEGITYIGGGQFVLTEERDRQAVKFTYVAGGTLARSAAQTVKLGTTIGNIGLEGLTYDPQTGGFIFTKEADPEGLFLTAIDFNAGTASNGTPATVNSANLFDPALANLEDMSDVFAFSNLPAMAGQPQAGNLLILSQESGRIRNIDRSGNILSTLTLVADTGNPLSIQNQTQEGITMDRDGVIYVVSENGGGDADHPQLWVYAPSFVANQAPTALVLSTASSSIPESSSTAAPIKMAVIVVTDADGVGVNQFSVSGADAASFQIIGSGLYLKAGTVLSYNTKPAYNITVNVDDTTVGATPDASANFTLNLTQVVGGSNAIKVTEVAPWSSGNSALAADWFELTNTGSTPVDISNWRMYDSGAGGFGSSGPLSGISSIAPGESVIFVDGAAKVPPFITNWYGASAPAGLQIGTYADPGLSTSGDAVNIYDAGGTVKASVTFGASDGTAPFQTFDNTAGLDNTSISLLSELGTNGAFNAAATTNEVGSPGSAVVSSTALVSITTTDANAAEAGADPGTFRISRTGSTTLAMDVVYTIANGSGQATSDDYTPPLASPATIPAGQSFVDVTIIPVDDAFVEGSETVILTLGDTGSYDVGSPVSATVSILDNDVANLPPTAVALTNTVAVLSESASTAADVKVADISVTDDGQGTNVLGLSGADAGFFTITGSSLYLKAGTVLNYGAKPGYSVSVTVDDSSVGSTPDASTNYSVTIAKFITPGTIVITEVNPNGSAASSGYSADWIELTNTSASDVDIAGWKMDDNSNTFASAVAFRGITTIPAGKSVVFFEGTADGSTDATIKANFATAWFGSSTPPNGVLIGAYGGSGVGLSGSGDAVNVFDASGIRVTGVAYGTVAVGATLDNKVAALGGSTLPLPAISTLSVIGTNSAFRSANNADTGSPGRNFPVTFLGVASGDADSTSSTLWTRINETIAPVLSVQISEDPAFTSPVSFSVAVDPGKDYTAKFTVSGLTPATKHYYRFVVTGSGETSQMGTFKTAPAAGMAAPLHFAFSGDMDGLVRPYALASIIPAQNLDFYVNLGDVIYENASNLTASGAHNGAPWLNSPSVTLSNDSLGFNGVPRAFISGGTPFATQAQLKADYEKKYRENFLPVNTGGQSALRDFYAAQGNYTTWDNHELGNRKYIDGGAPAGGSVGGPAGTDMPTGRGADARANGAGNPGNINDVNASSTDIMNRSTGFQTLRDVFVNYQPIADRGTITAPADPRTDGSKRLYSAQQWGKHATYINTDARSYRDIRLKTANAAADDTGTRADNPNRTYLGATQFAWLKQTLLDAHNAGTVWKFVSISDPIDQIGPIGGALTLNNLPSFGAGSTYAPVNADGGKAFMGGYRAERNALLKFIVDQKITNVVFLSTDDHQNRINELTYSPTGQLGTQSSYVRVPYCFSIVCGPLGATGPDLITNHTFAMAQQYADSLAAAQQTAGVEPLGLIGYPGLKNLQRVGDPTAATSPQAVDFYSPDTFNFTTLDVSADGKTLSVSSVGMEATTQNAGIEYANGPQAQTIFSFQIDAPTPVDIWRVYHFGTAESAGSLANEGDYDSDGIPNLVEYSLGTDPTIGTGVNGPDAFPVGSLKSVELLLNDRLSLSFSIPNPSPSDISYVVQSTDDLGTWADVASKTGAGPWTWLGGGASHIVTSGSDPDSVKIGDIVPSSENSRRLMRLKVNHP